jgi:hypothetical protein
MSIARTSRPALQRTELPALLLHGGIDDENHQRRQERDEHEHEHDRFHLPCAYDNRGGAPPKTDERIPPKCRYAQCGHSARLCEWSRFAPKNRGAAARRGGPVRKASVAHVPNPSAQCDWRQPADDPEGARSACAHIHDRRGQKADGKAPPDTSPEGRTHRPPCLVTSDAPSARSTIAIKRGTGASIWRQGAPSNARAAFRMKMPPATRAPGMFFRE